MHRHLANKLFSHAHNCFQTLLHIRRGRCPGRDADAHGRAPPPGGAARPAGAFLLHRRDHPPGSVVVTKRNHHLIQDHIVEDGIASGVQPFGKTAG